MPMRQRKEVQDGVTPLPRQERPGREDDKYEDLQLPEFSDDAKAEKESDEESLQEGAFPRYPKVDMSLPKLPPEQKALVKAWWKEIDPFFKKNDADEMLWEGGLAYTGSFLPSMCLF